MADIAKRVNFFKSIKFRAWLGILILSILPLLLLGLFAFDSLGNISRDILIEGNIQAFQQVKYEVDQYVSTFDDLIRYLATDERFVKEGQFDNAVEAMRHLDQSYESIERIIWVDSKGNLKAHSKKDVDSYKKMGFQEEALAKSNQPFLFAHESCLIKAKVSNAPDADAIIATISFQQLRKSLEGITFGTNFRYFLVTDSGEDILDEPNFPKDIIADLMSRPCGAYDLLPESNNNSPQIAISLPILRYGLKIFVFQDSSEVYSVARSLGTKTLNFVLLFALTSFVLAIYLSWTITSPVAVVADKALQLSEGESEVIVDIDRDDELGFLAKCFNNMSKSIHRRMTEINALYKVTNYINSLSNSKEALDLCLEHIVEIFKAKRGSIMLIDNERQVLIVESYKLAKTDIESNEPNKEINSTNKESRRFELKIGEGIAGTVASTGEAILCMDCLSDERFKNYSSDNSKSPKTLVAVPLRIQNKVIGVINLSDRSNSQPFTDSDLDLLQAIADQMALSIDNARLHDLSVINDETGLFVRKFLNIRIEDEIKRSKRFGFPLSIVIFSIDKLENINHNAVNNAFIEVGKLLKQTVRGTDIPAEYDNNKFCAVLAHTTEEQAKMFADRFLDKVKNHSIKSNNDLINITLSAGICQYSCEYDDFNILLSRTNEALAESSEIGNTTTIYTYNKKELNNE